MEFTDAVKQVEASDLFKDWKKEHDNWYLAHGFLMPQDSLDWQVGYSDGQQVVTFTLNPLQLVPAQEVNKIPGSTIPQLKIEHVTLSFSKAHDAFEKIKKEKYPTEDLFKKIYLIQQIDGKDMYNITGLTRGFKTLNIKIAMDGSIISEDLNALVEQLQGEK